MYFIFGLLLFIAYKRYSPKTDAHNGYIKFASVFFIMTSAFRHMYSSMDSYGYVLNLGKAVNKSWDSIFSDFWMLYFHPGIIGKDPGYYVFEKALSSITTNPQVFFLVIALFVFVPILLVWKKYSTSTFQTLVSSLFFLTFFYAYIPNSAARQAIAFGFVMMAYLYYERHNSKSYAIALLLVFIASFFHQTALIVLAVPFVAFFVRGPKMLIYGSIVAFVGMLFFYDAVGGFLGANNEVYDKYVEGTYYATTGQKPYLSIIFYALFFSIVALNYKYENNFQQYKILYVGGALSFVLMPILWLDPSAVRLVAYFGVWFSLLVPHIIDIMPSKSRQVYVILVMAALFLRLMISSSNYAFFWQGIPMPSVY